MPPTRRATVVLPVPGLPVNTRWRVIVGLFRPASTRSFSTRSRATCRWISRLTRCSPMRASSSASSSSRLLAGCAARRCGWVAAGRPSPDGTAPCARHRSRREPRRFAASAVPPPASRVHERSGGAHGGELGGGGDGGIADDAHRRLAELAGGRGDLGQRLGIGRGVRGPLGRERAEGRRGGLAPAAAAAGRVEEVLGGGAADGRRPVGGGPRRGLGHGRREGQGLLAGGRGVGAGGRGERGHRVDGLGQGGRARRWGRRARVRPSTGS